MGSIVPSETAAGGDAPAPPEISGEQGAPWVVALRASGKHPPLFFACAGGGDVLDYRDLAMAISGDRPVYAFGRPEDGDEASQTVEQLAALYVQQIRRLRGQGPYHVCGHSFGGLVAFEMAAILIRDGQDVGLVAVLDTLHPAFRRDMSARDRVIFQIVYLSDRLSKYGANLFGGKIDRILTDAMALLHGRLKRLSWKLTSAVFRKLDRAVPAAICTDALVLTAAWHAYSPKRYAVRAVFFFASERPPEYRIDRTLGWRPYVGGSPEICFVPGDHLTMLHPPHVQTLAGLLASHMVASEKNSKASEHGAR